MMLSSIRRRVAALLVISVLLVLAVALPTWCAVSGTWGW
jgi:hypothetical protein